MIGRVYRGSKVTGLVRYLYGPGRHNEHVDQRLVASWCGSNPQALALVEPEVTTDGGQDYRRLISELEAPMAYAQRIDDRPVWHCPLRTAPEDRILSDAEWAEIAEDLVHRTGIAPRGDDGGCRWIAVRHDEVSIHVVAVLARQDGRRAFVFRDFLQVRETCLAAEQRLGLVVTAPADKTAAVHTTRGEVEQADRHGHDQAARDWLREQVQVAAAGSREAEVFLERLRTGGVAVLERRDEAGTLIGYAVGRPAAGRATVFFGGRKLAADLSLPKLQARWTQAGVDVPVEGGEGRAQSRLGVWEQATAAAALATEQLVSGAPQDLAGAGDAAAAAGEVLWAASRLVEGAGGGPLTQAARAYDRAAREPGGGLPVAGRGGLALRAAALQLAKSGKQPGRSEAAQIALLVAQIGRLSVAVSRLREAQGRTAQATAARRAATAVGAASVQWTGQAREVSRVAETRAAVRLRTAGTTRGVTAEPTGSGPVTGRR